MSPTPQPGGDLLLELHANVATLIERTKDLPNLRDTVIRIERDVRHLAVSSQKHGAELERIQGAHVKTRERLALLKGEWKNVALMVGLIAEHFWRRLHS